jgi:hypothetical protein
MVSSMATSPAPTARAPRRLPWLGVLALILLSICAVVAWVVWETTAPGRSLQSLPAAERAELYRRTMDDLRTLCAPPRPAALRDHCRELAAVVAPLPECDDECVALVRPILAPAPTR